MCNHMKPWIVNLISTVQLTRLANAFAGVANLWFIALWSRTHPDIEVLQPPIDEMPLWVLLGLTAIIGIGLSTYAGVVNDLFDLRHDQTFSPDKPLPAGRISPPVATFIGFFSLILAVVASIVLGPLPSFLCLAVAMLILFYNAMARFLPGLGFVTYAAIHGLLMLMIHFGLLFIWPVLLIMVHTAVISAVVHKLEDKRPRISIWTILGGTFLMFILGLLLWAQTGFKGPVWNTEVFSPYGLLWPIAAIIVFAGTVISKVRFASSPAFAAEKLQRYGALWMGVYGLSWLLGGGLYNESLILGSLVLIGVLWMALIRDLGAWIEQPIGYRW